MKQTEIRARSKNVNAGRVGSVKRRRVQTPVFDAGLSVNLRRKVCAIISRARPKNGANRMDVGECESGRLMGPGQVGPANVKKQKAKCFELNVFVELLF